MMLIGGGKLKMHSKDASQPDVTDHGEPTSHGFSEVLGQRESQTRAVYLGGYSFGSAVERFENAIQFGSCDTNAMVFDGNCHLLISVREPMQRSGNTDAAIGAAIFYGIGDKVLQASAGGEHIPQDPRQMGLNGFFQSAVFFAKRRRNISAHSLQD